MDFLSEQCALGRRTNLCSVTGKTGMGEKAVGRGARGSGLPSPARRLFRGACHVETSIYRVSTFFVSVCSAAALSSPRWLVRWLGIYGCVIACCGCQCTVAALSSPRWPVRWHGIYGCVTPFAKHSFIRRQVVLTLCERPQPPSLTTSKCCAFDVINQRFVRNEAILKPIACYSPILCSTTTKPTTTRQLPRMCWRPI